MAGDEVSVSKSADLTSGSIRAHMWRMAVPAGIGLFFNTMFNVIDSFWAGAVSTQALAALSLSFPVFFSIIALTQGVSTAASALISYHIGRKEEEEAHRMAGQILGYAFFTSLVLMAFGLLCAEPIFLFLGAEGEYLDYALQYIIPIFWCAGVFVCSATLNGLLLSRGNVKAMRDTLVWGFLLNCFLDPWLLYGGWGMPAFGIRGIAYATITVSAVGIPYLAWTAKRLDVLPHCSRCSLVPSLRHQLRILSHAVPAAVNMMTVAIGMFVTTYFIQGFGYEAVAAFGVGLRVEQIALLPSIGVYLSILALVGQNYGAQKMDRIEESLKIGMRISLSIMTLGAIAEYFFPEILLRIFTNDKAVIAYGSTYLRVAALISWSYVIASNCIATLQGMHQPYFAIGVSLFRQFLARMVAFWAVLAYTSWGINGIWWSIFVINWVAAAYTVWYTRRSLEKLRERFAE
jgi:putative MATE family efflux protein